MDDGTDEENPREWPEAQINARIEAFVADIDAFVIWNATLQASPYDGAMPADKLRREAVTLPRATCDALIRGGAAIVIAKIEHTHEDAGTWCSVLKDLLGIDW